MTITKTYAPDKYAGDGVQVDFPVTFDFLDSGNVKATVTDAAGVDTALVAGVDYSVTGATLTTTVPVASGSRLTIWLDADYLQDTDWKNTGNYNLETLERAMDKAAVERQILKEAFSRTVTLPLTSEDTPENYLGQVSAARDAAVTARGGAEAAQAAAESAASTAASDTVAAASSLLSGYVTSAEASKNAAAQSAADAEAAANNLTAQTAEFTVGVGGQAVFDTGWPFKAEVKNIRLFADGVLQQDAFPCDENGDPVTTGETHYINAGLTIPEGVRVFISSVDTAALGSITALANSAAASAQAAEQASVDAQAAADSLPAGGEPGQVLILQEDGSKAWGTVAGVPVGQLCFSTTASPLPGTVPVNVKQKFALDVYPQLEAWVRSCGDYLATEAEWDAEAAAQEGTCGRYALTDTHIILPCYKHYFAAAQDGVAGKGVGDWAGDAIRNITGDIGVDAVGSNTTGAFVEAGSVSTYQGAAATGNYQHFSADRVVPTADENRPKTVYVLPCIKVSDVAVNASQVDMLALSGQVAEINGSKVDRSEWVELVPDLVFKRPDGIIEQYGEVALPATSNVVVTLPVTFPNKIIDASFSFSTTSTLAVISKTASDITLRADSAGTAYWRATGK